MKPSPHWDRILAQKNGTYTDVGENVDTFLRRSLNIHPEDDLEEALAKVEQELDQMQIPEAEGFPSYSPNQLAQAMAKTLDSWGWTFENESFRNFLREICNYFGNQNSKGLFIIGPPGLGKSKTMQLMSKMIQDTEEAFKPLQVSEIVMKWTELKFSIATDLSKQVTGKIYRDWQGGDKRKYHLLIDDIGREEFEKTYSYGKNPIRIAIEARHLLWERHGVKTHFITNFEEELVGWYGDALFDRMMGMSEVIKLEGISKR